MNVVIAMQNHGSQQYGDISKLCYMDMDSFIVHIKLEDVYENLAEDVKTKFDTLNYEVKRP